ncbi:hypothetical protein [Bacillus altitudinis]|uniref:hypothetical protein n=1 Tax=Bacillus altitudinis TaxID=293387 RepID=UPI00119D341C|nr:hypothetical protein [Bacillus altitudinis]
MDFIELSGPVITTQGNITIIDTNNPSVVTAAIAYSKVLNATTTTSTSPAPKAIVFTEMEKYLKSNPKTAGNRVAVQGKRLEW